MRALRIKVFNFGRHTFHHPKTNYEEFMVYNCVVILENIYIYRGERNVNIMFFLV